MSGANFKAIASVSVIYPVGVTRIKSLQFTVAQIITYHCIKMFIKPSKQKIFNKNIVSGKNFKAMASVVYVVIVAKNFERFLAILHKTFNR